MIYLASPYTHDDPAVRQERFEAVCAKLAHLAVKAPHLVVYSPIAHWHPVALAHNLPVDHTFWQHQDRAMITRSDALWVLALPGYLESIGVNSEVQFALDLHKPVVYCPPVVEGDL